MIYQIKTNTISLNLNVSNDGKIISSDPIDLRWINMNIRDIIKFYRINYNAIIEILSGN